MTETTPATDRQEPILAPEEIDALMQAIAPQEQAHALFASLPPIPQPEQVDSFDFASAVEDSPEKYPLFLNLQQRLAETLKEQWTDTFKREIPVGSAQISRRIYQDILQDDVEAPQVFFVYNVEGFGRMMVSCELTLIVAYIDAMLGGHGEVFGQGSDILSPVELSLAKRIASSLEKLLSNMWSPVREMHFSLIKLEVDPQFLAVASSTDPCFSAQYEIKTSEELRGAFYIHYPRTFLEPVLDSLRSVISDEPLMVDEEWESTLQTSMEQVPLSLRLELGQCQLDIQQFLALREGDLLPLSKSEQEPSTLWVSSIPRFQAMPGSQDGMLAAELLEKLNHE
ncbi:MAG: FliM/FliN family flagellar motor switch protein [Mariprofundaceae bacterium]|nr:FliM/FliN family flagellar motor switch protein [Mariprofundaceae bacterium]